MPELFGNAYVLPAVIVVVLLLVLVLILMMRRRRHTSRTDTRSLERPVTPPARPTRPAEPVTPTEPATATEPTTRTEPALSQPLEAPAAPVAPVTPVAQTTVSTPLFVAADATRAPITPVTRTGRPPEKVAVEDDPLRAVILDIIHGWGDLTSEDTNRLALFKPDKILAAAEAIELPKEDASGGYARSRLLQIRKYAADRQLQHKPPEAASPAEPEATLETEALVKAAEIKPEDSMPSWETPQQGVAMGGAGLATVAFAAATQSGEPEDRQSLERALAEGESEWTQPAEFAVASPWLEEPQPAEPVAASPWAEEPHPAESAGWDVSEPPVLEEVPVLPDEGTLLVAAAVADIATEEEPPPTEDMMAQVQAPEDSLSSLHLRVRTAEELLALPAGDQADMLAFLEPAELARVFEASDDRMLKKATIDVLENLGTPASLDVLRRCLDDPDPEMQLYALDAADRLLGVE